MKTLKRVCVSGVAVAMLFGCQEVEEPKTVLTQQQWQEIRQNILTEAPNPQYAINANFGDKIELIGMDVHSPLTPGKEIEITWYWKAKADVGKNWNVFVHLDSQVKPVRQNLDHVPMDGMFPTGHWKKGQIIKSRQKASLRPDMPNGKAIPYIGLFDAKSPKMLTRLPLVGGSPDDLNRAKGPELTIVGGKVSATPKDAPATATGKKRYAVRSLSGEQANIEIDGRLAEPTWNTLPPARLTPFGSGQKYETWVKMFATDEALYIAAYVEDKHAWGTFTERDSDTWKQEVLEVFIDTNADGKDYFEFQIMPNGTIFDANFKERLGSPKAQGTREEQIDRARAWNMEGLEAKVVVDGTVNNDKDQDKSWTVEIKMPFKSLPGAGKAPAPGDKWAVNFYRFDRPEAKKSFAYAWSTEPRGDFHEVSKFGELRFVPAIDRIKKIELPKERTRATPDPTAKPVDLKPKIPKLKLDGRKKGRLIQVPPTQK